MKNQNTQTPNARFEVLDIEQFIHRKGDGDSTIWSINLPKDELQRFYLYLWVLVKFAHLIDYREGGTLIFGEHWLEILGYDKQLNALIVRRQRGD